MQISKLDAAKLSQETTIKDLKANIISLQSKLNKLESEHDELGKKFSSHTVQADSEIKQLQQVKKKNRLFSAGKLILIYSSTISVIYMSTVACKGQELTK